MDTHFRRDPLSPEGPLQLRPDDSHEFHWSAYYCRPAKQPLLADTKAVACFFYQTSHRHAYVEDYQRRFLYTGRRIGGGNKSFKGFFYFDFSCFCRFLSRLAVGYHWHARFSGNYLSHCQIWREDETGGDTHAGNHGFAEH